MALTKSSAVQRQAAVEYWNRFPLSSSAGVSLWYHDRAKERNTTHASSNIWVKDAPESTEVDTECSYQPFCMHFEGIEPIDHSRAAGSNGSHCSEALRDTLGQNDGMQTAGKDAPQLDAPLRRSASSWPVLAIEMGSLSALSADETQFFGSSSGVFFANTVLREFSKATAEPPPHSNPSLATESASQASVNNCISDQDNDSKTTAEPSLQDLRPSTDYSNWCAIISHGLGRPPGITIAKELVMLYFENWHPIFPFLHGPTFFQDVESLYTDENSSRSIHTPQDREAVLRIVVFQCIFNIAALDCPSAMLPPESQIESATVIMPLIGILATRHDTRSLQALLAAQLYLIASMSLQAASTIGGILLRNIFPWRFAPLPLSLCPVITTRL